MTVTISFADANDGRIVSSSSSYSTALAGSSLSVDTASSTLGTWGQRQSGSSYQVYEYFASFPYSVVSTEGVVAAYFEVYNNTSGSGGPSRSMEVREYNWGTSLTTGNFRNTNGLNALTQLAAVNDPHNAGVGEAVRASNTELMERLRAGSGPIRVVMFSSRTRLQNTPTSAEAVTQVYTGNHSTLSPRLVITSVPISTLNRATAYQVQLTDGTHVYVEHDTAGFDTARSIKHRNHAGVVTTVFSESPNFRAGAQNYALVRDNSDNLYVINTREIGQTLNVRGLTKLSGYNWSAAEFQTIQLPNYTGGDFNQVVAAWHPVGSGGTIVAVAANGPGRNSGVYVAYALLHPPALLNNTSNVLRNSGTAANVLYHDSGASGFNSYVNETSSLLDISIAPGSTNRGYVSTAVRRPLDGVSSPSVARYQLNSNGTGFSSTAMGIGSGIGGLQVKKDANSKLRVIGVSTSQFLVVGADPGANKGVTVCLVQNVGTSTGFNNLAQARLGELTITNMPTPSTIAISNVWDCVYDPNTNWVWIYYLSGNSLRKTHVDLNTGLAAGDSVLISSSVGVGGSTNLALRVHRGITVGERVLLTVANRTSGGTHSTIYFVDSLNAPPFAPTLLNRTNFNALNNAVFSWVFNDPNSQDSQSAFQLEISLTNGTIVHNTNKVTSSAQQRTVTGGTLSNGVNYRWRVRTWDSEDQVSPWANYRTFTTSASGTLNILQPTEDNPPNVLTKDNTVVWEVVGQTQVAYRVVVVRTDTGATLVNTGWVTSTDTSYLIQDMESDVEYQIQVTARNNVSVETNTATRLLTPSYGAPEVPVISVEPVHRGGYIQVSVVNPEPQGDRPDPIRNDIYRSPQGKNTFLLVGSTEAPEGSFRDYSAIDGVVYDYFARAVTS